LRDDIAGRLGLLVGLVRNAPEPEPAGGDVVVTTTGVGAGRGAARVVALPLVFGAGLDAVAGASGVGASDCDRLVPDEVDVALEGDSSRVTWELDAPLVGASAIRGAASLRAPTGGLSGVGADAPKAGGESAAASIAEHAATAIRPRRSVSRRDDVPVDIRPSLSR
jgi:hypothetical protein